MRRILWLSILSILLAASAQAADTIRIGLIGPLTGPWSSQGKEMKQVVDMMADDLNGRGGLLGKKVEIIAENDEGTARGAVQASVELVNKGVVAVIGSLTSASTEASQNIFNDAKILQITNASTAVGLTEKKLKYFFRTCPRDDEQSRVMVQTIGKMNLRRIAILHDGSLYAKGLADDVRGQAAQKGLLIVYEEALTPGQEDYSAVLKAIKERTPDAVFYAGYYQEAGVLLRQRKEMNWDTIFIGGDGASNPNLTVIAGKKAAEGFYFLSPPLPGDLTSKEAVAFISRFKKKYGNAPASIDSILAGDAFRVIVNGIRETGALNADKLADYLHTRFVDPSGMTGSINFNFKGDRLSDLYGVYRVDADGHPVIQRMFQYGRIIK